MLFSSIINYTKKSLRPHGLGDFSVRGVFLQPLFAKIFSLNTLVDKGKSFEEKSVNISIYQGTGSSIKAGYCDRIRAESSDDHAEFK